MSSEGWVRVAAVVFMLVDAGDNDHVEPFAQR